MTTDLTVAEYDQAEQDATLELTNLVIQAFQPVVFQHVGYPTRIRRESELFKYVDVMHELRFERDFTRLLGGLSEEEFATLRQLTELICSFTESQFGVRAIARSTVLQSLNVLRHIKYVTGEARPPVFEFGPGCGYLGAMLMLEGYPYAATDVSQAFYLYQNHFWNFISNGKVTELAQVNVSGDTLRPPEPGGAAHIPWWEFVKLEPGSTPTFDIVSCNHALCEMHTDSLGFTLNIARSFMSKAKNPAFVFEGWGGPIINSTGIVADRFHRSGFALAHNDSKITVATSRDGPSALDSLSWPIHRSRLLMRAHNLLRKTTGKARMHPYEPLVHVSGSNPLSKAILESRQSETRCVGIEQVHQFYFDLMGDKAPLSPDERFWISSGTRAHPLGAK